MRRGCTRLPGCSGLNRAKQQPFRFHAENPRRKPHDESAAPLKRSVSRVTSMLQDSEIGAITTGGPFGHPAHSKYEKLISFAKEVPPATTVIAHPCDETSLRGAREAAELGIVVPILVGP